MLRFKPQNSGVGSDRSINWATTTALKFIFLYFVSTVIVQVQLWASKIQFSANDSPPKGPKNFKKLKFCHSRNKLKFRNTEKRKTRWDFNWTLDWRRSPFVAQHPRGCPINNILLSILYLQACIFKSKLISSINYSLTCGQIQCADACYHFYLPGSLIEKHEIVELDNTCGQKIF